MLIDWLTFDLPYRGARVFSQEFEKPWDSDIIRPKRISRHGVEGSFSNKMQVLCAEGRMNVSGNPVKFFSGQNIIGMYDLQELVLLTYEAVLIACNIPDCPEARAAISDGTVNLTRVDVTDHWDVGTDDDCRVFLQALGDRASIRKRGRGHFNSDFCSVGWGFGNDLSNGDKKNGSRRSTLKFYNKFEEIKRHPMTCAIAAQKLLSGWIEGKVRVEACFRGMELKRLGYKLSRDWDEQAPRALLNTFLERLEMPDQVTLLDNTEVEVPRAVRASYDLWASGFCIKSRLSKPTFYRHRQILLEHGIDISIPKKDVQRPGRTLQLVRILEAKPAAFPHEHLFQDMALEGFERLREACFKKAA